MTKIRDGGKTGNLPFDTDMYQITETTQNGHIIRLNSVVQAHEHITHTPCFFCFCSLWLSYVGPTEDIPTTGHQILCNCSSSHVPQIGFVSFWSFHFIQKTRIPIKSLFSVTPIFKQEEPPPNDNNNDSTTYNNNSQQQQLLQQQRWRQQRQEPPKRGSYFFHLALGFPLWFTSTFDFRLRRCWRLSGRPGCSECGGQSHCILVEAGKCLVGWIGKKGPHSQLSVNVLNVVVYSI